MSSNLIDGGAVRSLLVGSREVPLALIRAGYARAVAEGAAPHASSSLAQTIRNAFYAAVSTTKDRAMSESFLPRTHCRWKTLLLAGGTLISLNSGVAAAASAAPQQPIGSCGALMQAHWTAADMRIVSAETRPAGLVIDLGRNGKSPPLPSHCEVIGVLQERVGADGQDYAIHFHLRLPEHWNGRFLFQGGGGTNGDIGDAIGMTPNGSAPALTLGFAVVSQDSGHSNEHNADPRRGGTVSFGFDAQARQNYGHASLKLTYDAARAILLRHYGRDPLHSYFAGCSKGGQEGMAFAQRYPEAFDGILAAAPGFALPKAAIAEAWDTQTYAALVRQPEEPSVPVGRLTSAFSDSDLQLVRSAILAACDAKDGLADGLVQGFAACTTREVSAALRARQCSGAKGDACLYRAQIEALLRGFGGAKDSRGRALYASFPWDAGVTDPGWRVWKLGLSGGGPFPAVPAINVAMGAPALATIFSTPPRLLGPDPQSAMDAQLAYDFDRDPAAIFATSPGFPRSGWEDISARSADLARFRAHGGKMIVPHGASDPVFSLNDTLDWWRQVDQSNDGNAASFVRVFAVPGMAHCAGGPATDQFDALAALVRWVEQGEAPDRIEASAGPRSPWPGRSRPLCPYPLIARPLPGESDTEKSSAFACSS